jgi:hypothetical protein
MSGVYGTSKFALLYFEVGGWLESGSQWVVVEGRVWSLCFRIMRISITCQEDTDFYGMLVLGKGVEQWDRVWLGMGCLDLRLVERTWFVI